MDPQVFIDIAAPDLPGKVQEYADLGWRFVNLCGSAVEGGVELIYSFSNGEPFENLRLIAGPDDDIPSISDLYFNAFVFENEVHALFGTRITDMVIDFGDSFYATSVPTPMNPVSPDARASFTIRSRSAARDGDDKVLASSTSEGQEATSASQKA
ncbi:MAG: NADH-quinone oxidoreductase subunit C [Coriobacteriales bacterium]|jgi:ech hydrogenase subunit D|nr:NADH-quinone oxidoreductase subunit C [Coriobacteriales bacterium]